MSIERYDVIVIGSGAGGGTLAYRLAPSGKRIQHLDEHHGRCGTRLHVQDEPQISGGIASKGKETGPHGSDCHTAEHARLLLRRREAGGRQCCRPLSPLHDPRHGSLRPARADGAGHHRGQASTLDETARGYQPGVDGLRP